MGWMLEWILTILSKWWFKMSKKEITFLFVNILVYLIFLGWHYKTIRDLRIACEKEKAELIHNHREEISNLKGDCNTRLSLLEHMQKERLKEIQELKQETEGLKNNDKRKTD